MKTMPKIQKVMTTCPHSIGFDISISKAKDMMREFGIRHLPVQNGAKLVGVVTDRDVKLASTFKGAVDLKSEDIMTPDPYVISPNAELSEVVSEMAEHKYGCAIIVDNNKVVGIFTATDALRVLSDTLAQNYKH
jgi:acetoin utilization protein AcuB